MATNSSKIPVNGHSKHEEASSAVTGLSTQAPLIDDSLIVDDDEGLPLISAVFSLATDGKSDEGAKLASSISTTSSSQIIYLGKPSSLHSSYPIKSGTLLNSDSVTSKLTGDISVSEFQSKGSLSTSQHVGNDTLGAYVNRTPREITNSLENTDVNSDSHQRRTSVQMAEATSRTASAVTHMTPNVQSSANMLHLVKLVNSVNKGELLQRIPTASTVNVKSPPPITMNKMSANVPANPGAHLPRQIAMKQPAPGNRQTSIVLNLKPGEPLPKAINLLGPDGKSMVMLALADGGKQLVTPSGAPHTGTKILIPIPSNVASSSPAAKQVSLVNKVYPIAPHPVKTTALTSQGSAPPLIFSVSGPSQKPIVASSVIATKGLTVFRNVSKTPESCVYEKNPIVSNGEFGSSLGSSSTSKPTKIAPLEPKPSSSEGSKSPGLSPQEAKIQRLKEIIKRQEDAVNKLREKRRLEIERIRDPSKLDDTGTVDDTSKTERLPLAEQKRPSSPFAVPLPPKKRIKEYDSSFKTNVTKATDSSVTPSECAFIPNADDKAFVQLVGLENVVNSIK